MKEKIIDENYISTTKALEFIKSLGIGHLNSTSAIVDLARRKEIGKKVLGRWYIHKQKLIELLESGK